MVFAAGEDYEDPDVGQVSIPSRGLWFLRQSV